MSIACFVLRLSSARFPRLTDSSSRLDACASLVLRRDSASIPLSFFFIAMVENHNIMVLLSVTTSQVVTVGMIAMQALAVPRLHVAGRKQGNLG